MVVQKPIPELTGTKSYYIQSIWLLQGIPLTYN